LLKGPVIALGFARTRATRPDGQPLTFAAIHDTWTNRETNEKLRSVSMVITEPNKFVREVHDRMPVILEDKDFEQWESGDAKDAAAFDEAGGGRCVAVMAGGEDGQ